MGQALTNMIHCLRAFAEMMVMDLQHLGLREVGGVSEAARRINNSCPSGRLYIDNLVPNPSLFL